MEYRAATWRTRRLAAEPCPLWSIGPFAINVLPLKAQVKDRVTRSPTPHHPLKFEITFCVRGVQSLPFVVCISMRIERGFAVRLWRLPLAPERTGASVVIDVGTFSRYGGRVGVIHFWTPPIEQVPLCRSQSNEFQAQPIYLRSVCGHGCVGCAAARSAADYGGPGAQQRH